LKLINLLCFFFFYDLTDTIRFSLLLYRSGFYRGDGACTTRFSLSLSVNPLFLSEKDKNDLSVGFASSPAGKTCFFPCPGRENKGFSFRIHIYILHAFVADFRAELAGLLGQVEEDPADRKYTNAKKLEPFAAAGRCGGTRFCGLPTCIFYNPTEVYYFPSTTPRPPVITGFRPYLFFYGLKAFCYLIGVYRCLARRRIYNIHRILVTVRPLLGSTTRLPPR